MRYEDAKKIKYLGRYRVKGDIVYVKGILIELAKNTVVIWTYTHKRLRL